MLASTTLSPSTSSTWCPAVVSTGAAVEERAFTWKIEDFDMVRQSDELIAFQKYQFQAGSDLSLPVRMELGLGQCTSNLKGDMWRFKMSKVSCIGAFLKLVSKPEDAKEVIISYRMQINDSNGSAFYQDEGSMINIAAVKDEMICCPLMHRDGRKIPLVDGCLIIEVNFKIFGVKHPIISLDVPTKVEEFQNKAKQQLAADLEKVDWEECQISDTAIVSNDGILFRVNRKFIGLRSPGFVRLLPEGVKEGQSAHIKIRDASSKTLHVLIRYLTDATLHDDWKAHDVIKELIVAANDLKLGLMLEFFDEILGSVAGSSKDQNPEDLFLLASKLGLKKAEEDLKLMVSNQVIIKAGKSLENVVAGGQEEAGTSRENVVAGGQQEAGTSK